MNSFDPLSFSLGVIVAAIVFLVFWILADLWKLSAERRRSLPVVRDLDSGCNPLPPFHPTLERTEETQ